MNANSPEEYSLSKNNSKITQNHAENIVVEQNREARFGVTLAKTVSLPQTSKTVNKPEKENELSSFNDVIYTSISEADWTANLLETQYYDLVCKLHGVIPCEFIKRNLKNHKIIVKNRPFGPMDVYAFSISFPKNNQINAVGLCGNDLQDLGGIAIAELIGKNVNCNIFELDLSENRIGSIGVEALCESLSSNETIRIFNLSANMINDKDAIYLAKMIQKNIRISNLNLSYNNIRESGAEFIADSLKSNDTINELNLSHNHIRGVGSVALAKCLEINIGLKMLNLKSNGFDLQGSLSLAEALKKNRFLERLEISNNRIPAKGLLHIIHAISNHNNSLSAIQIDRNGITPIIANQILRLIYYGLETNQTALKELILGESVVDNEFYAILNKIHAKMILRVEVGIFIKNKTKEHRRKLSDLDISADPIDLLFHFMKKENLRVVDLFQRFDLDNSESLTKKEFKDGLKSANVPLTLAQLDEIVEILDVDKDGEVGLGELIKGERNFKRKEIIKEKRKKKSKAQAEDPFSQASMAMLNQIDL